MNKFKSPLRILSPKSTSNQRAAKSPSSTLTSPRSVRTSDADSLKRTNILLSEENGLLKEYRHTATLKLQELKEKLQKKEGHLQNLKSFYEAEINSLQESMQILKGAESSNPDRLLEQFNNEKSRSMAFYRALVKKQSECEESHKTAEEFNKLESELFSYKDQVVQLQKLSKDKNREIDKLTQMLLEEKRSIELYYTSKVKNLLNAEQNSTELTKKKFNEKVKKILQESSEKFNELGCALSTAEDRVDEIERRQRVIMEQHLGNNARFKDMTGPHTVNHTENPINEVHQEKLRFVLEEFDVFIQKLVEIVESNSPCEEMKTEIIELIKRNKDIINENLKQEESNSDRESARRKASGTQNLDLIKALNEENCSLKTTQKELIKRLKESEAENRKLLSQYTDKLNEIVTKEKKNIELQKILAHQDIKIVSLTSPNSSANRQQSNSRKSSTPKTTKAKNEKKVKLTTENPFKLCIPPQSQHDVLTKIRALEVQYERLEAYLNEHESLSSKNLTMKTEVIEQERLIGDIKDMLMSQIEKEVKNSLIYQLIEEQNNKLKEDMNALTEKLRESDALIKETEDLLKSEVTEKVALVSSLQASETTCKSAQSLNLELASNNATLSAALEAIHQQVDELKSAIKVNESEKRALQTQLIFEKKQLEDTQASLNDYIKTHSESLRLLSSQEEKISNLIKSLEKAEQEILSKESEIVVNDERFIALNQRFFDIKDQQEDQLRYYEELIGEFSLKEKENLINLQRLQEADNKILSFEEEILTKDLKLKNMQSLIDDFRKKIENSEVKQKTLKQTVSKVLSTLNEFPIQRSRTLSLTPKSIHNLRHSSENTPSSLYKFLEIYNEKLSTLISDLEVLERNSGSPSSESKLSLIRRIQRECHENAIVLTADFEPEHFYENMIQSSKELEKKLEMKIEEINEKEEIERQLKGRIKALEEDNARFRAELEVNKESYCSLGYSVSEDSIAVRKLINDEISLNLADVTKESKKNMLIVDVFKSGGSEMSSPDLKFDVEEIEINNIR